jgi:hypothetical protein
MVNAPNQPSESDIVHDVVNALVGLIRVGYVVCGKKYTGRCLNNCQKERGTPQRESPIDFGDFTVKDGIVHRTEPEPFIQPM